MFESLRKWLSGPGFEEPLFAQQPLPPAFEGGDNFPNQLRIGMVVDWLDSRPDVDLEAKETWRLLPVGDRAVNLAGLLTRRIDRAPRWDEILENNDRTDLFGEYGVLYHAHITAHMDDDEVALAEPMYRRLHELQPACLSALMNLAEIERRGGRIDDARKLLREALELAAGSKVRRHGVLDSKWESPIRCALARLGNGADVDVESWLAMCSVAGLCELTKTLRGFGSWEKASVVAHTVFPTATPQERLFLHAAMRIAPVLPQPPPAAYDDVGAFAEVEALVRDNYERCN